MYAYIYTVYRIYLHIYNQSIIVFCPRAGLSLQAQHSSLYTLLSLPFRIFVQSIYHNVVYHLISSSASKFLPNYHPSRASFSRQFLLSQWPSQFSFPLLYQFQHYSSFSQSSWHKCIFYFVCLFYTLHPSPFLNYQLSVGPMKPISCLGKWRSVFPYHIIIIHISR